jgi:hypothetical protein
MADTGAPWNIPYATPTDLVRGYPAVDEAQALAVASGLTSAFQLVGGTALPIPSTNVLVTSTTVIGSAVTYTPVFSDSVLVVTWDGLVETDRASGSPRFRSVALQIQELDDTSTWVIRTQGVAGLQLTSTSSSNAGVVVPFTVRAVSQASRTGFTGARSFRARAVPNTDTSAGFSQASNNPVGDPGSYSYALTVLEYRTAGLL